MLQITIFYNQGAHGFSEVWYQAGDTPPLQIPKNDGVALRNAVFFRAPLTTIEWVRYSVVDKPQLVNSFRLSDTYTSGQSANTTPDVVGTDCIWRIFAGNFARRNILLRGLPDDSVVRDAFTGAFKPTALLNQNVLSYLNGAFNAGWLIRYQNNAKFGGAQRTSVNSIAQSTGDTTLAAFIIKSGYPLDGGPTKKVRFTGHLPDAKIPGWPRQCVLKSFDITSGVATISYPYAPPVASPYTPKKLFVEPVNYMYAAMANYQFQSLSSRQTGRPFGAGRGRRQGLFSSR